MGEPTYKARINVPVTQQMYDFVDLLSKRHKTTMADVARQAIREHMDHQEDVITSRSRLGRTVMRELAKMHHQIMAQLTYLAKLMVAAIIIQMTEDGHKAGDVTRRIVSLANQPALDKMVRGKKSE